MSLEEGLLANRKVRAWLTVAFVVGMSAAAGWGIYTRTGKVLGIVAFVTLGIFLRQATFPNGFMLVVLAAQLSFVRFELVADEFEIDKWIALIGMAALSIAIVAFQIHDPPWPGLGHLLALGIMTIAAFSTWWSLDPWLSFAKAGAFGMGMAVVFLGVWGWARSLERIRALVDRFLDTYWLVFPLGALVLLLPVPGKYQAGRFQSIYTNPNQIGFWGSVGLPLLLSQAMTHPSRMRRRICALMFVTGAACVVMSGSRGGMLGVAIGCTSYLLLRFPLRTASVLTVLGVAFLFVRGYGVDLSGIGESEIVRSETIGDLSDRKMWWEIGVLIAAQRRWLGHGFGIGESLFEHYMLDFHVETYGPTIHNSYLDSYMTIGLLGTACLIALQCWCGWLGLRTWWRDRDGELGLLALGLLASSVATSAHAVVETVVLLVGNPWTIPFYTFLVLQQRMARMQVRERSARRVARAAPRALQPVAADT